MSESTPADLQPPTEQIITDQRAARQAHLDAACIKIMETLDKYSLDDRLFIFSHLAAYHIAPGQKVHEFKFQKMYEVHLKHHRKKLHQLRMVAAGGAVKT